MIKEKEQREFLLEQGFNEEQLNYLSPSDAIRLIDEVEVTRHAQRQAKEHHSLFGSINQCVPFLNYFIEFAKSKFDDEAIKAKLDEIVNDFWQFELFD